MSFFSQPGILNALDPWASPAITVGLTANSEADAEQNATILQPQFKQHRASPVVQQGRKRRPLLHRLPARKHRCGG